MSTPLASELPSEIESRRAEIDEICARFGVRRLEVFGSAATGAFDPARSDLDFMVEFDAARHIRPLEQYFGLKEAFEDLFKRAVDLVEAGASSNPYFLQSVNKSRRLVVCGLSQPSTSRTSGKQGEPFSRGCGFHEFLQDRYPACLKTLFTIARHSSYVR